MKYMLLIYAGEKVLSDEEREHCYAESTELCHELNSRESISGRQPAAAGFDGDTACESAKASGC